ncbi:hypothetical protein DFP74_2622 [Nocardiopsis sp. Huas11]|uniref:ABC-three component system protein n=1 Tax=Nocardiopsis sp. Huas11 TaxID=2183912 RepID=UPI000EB3BE78|nr:ABC-three component system protein [Nocardiopsis sp. Huas11]RKS06972.1 hypothetical protein DFP74_2622 [Nocardiopsis sp. Huas11]
MHSWRREFARPKLGNKLATLHGQSFEDFFHELMELADPGFFPVRTSQGDLGADGLAISDRKLYACYGPRVFKPSEVREKFRGDLVKAVENRGGDFDRFVFVHNELRGVSPEVTKEISEAQKEYAPLRFENFGLTRMCQVLTKLDDATVEDLVGPFPATELVTGVGMGELAPLLEHLSTRKRHSVTPDGVPVPSSRKLEYNRFSDEMRDFLLKALPYVRLVGDYYRGLNNPFEEDEVAAAFRQEYVELADSHEDPDTVADHLRWYILGNKAASLKDQIDANVVLMHFFGRCEVFRVPPTEWRPHGEVGGGGAV